MRAEVQKLQLLSRGELGVSTCGVSGLGFCSFWVHLDHRTILLPASKTFPTPITSRQAQKAKSPRQEGPTPPPLPLQSEPPTPACLVTRDRRVNSCRPSFRSDLAFASKSPHGLGFGSVGFAHLGLRSFGVWDLGSWVCMALHREAGNLLLGPLWN